MNGAKDAIPDQEPSFKAMAESSALLLALSSAWLYLAGWTYAYHYFDRFDLPLLLIDLPLEHYFVYGFSVLRHYSVWAGLTLIVILALVWLKDWIPTAVRRHRVIIAGVATVLFFWLGHAAGMGAAHAQFLQQRTTDYAAYPRIHLWLTSEAKQNQDNLSLTADLTKGCYRLLLHSQDRLFLFRSFKGAPAADLPTLIFPWSEIAAVRILPEHSSCL